jgi:hypothetical protein
VPFFDGASGIAAVAAGVKAVNKVGVDAVSAIGVRAVGDVGEGAIGFKVGR